MNTFLNHMIGNNHIYFFSGVIFMLLGAFITMMFDVDTRDKHKKKQSKFSLRYFWNRNRFRVIGEILMALLIVRFSNILFPQFTSNDAFFVIDAITGMSLDILYNKAWHKVRGLSSRMIDRLDKIK